MYEKLVVELLEKSLSHDGTGREMRFVGGDVVPVVESMILARDVVPVVRCKDCCWSAMATPLGVGQEHLVCCLGTSEENPVVRSVDENNFCSAGERREADV